MRNFRNKLWNERSSISSILSTSFISTITSVILMLIFANTLTKETLGTYQYIIAAVSFICAFSLTGTSNALIRAIGKGHYGYIQTAKKYLTYGIMSSTLIGILVGLYYLYQGNFLLGFSIPISALLMSLIYYQQKTNVILVAVEQFKRSNYLLKANALAPLFLLLPLVFFTQNAGVLAAFYFLSSLLGISITIYLFSLNCEEKELQISAKKISLGAKDKIQYFYFVAHQSIITLVSIGTTHADKILIFQLLGAQQTALYYIAISLPERIKGTLKQFEPFLFSKFAKYPRLSAQQEIGEKFIFTLFLIIPVYIGFYFLTPIFFSLFLPDYQESILLTQIYGLTLFASSAIIPYSFLKAHSSNDIFYYYTFFTSCTRIIFVVVGIIQFQLAGAIVGATLSTLINTLMLLALTLRYRSRHTAIIQ